MYKYIPEPHTAEEAEAWIRGNLVRTAESCEAAADPRRNYSFTYPNRYAGNGNAEDVRSRERYVWMTLHQRLFRALGETAGLIISDWAAPDKPGGPIGQEIMYNFIEVEPYFEAGSDRVGKDLTIGGGGEP